jgi:hypothetical protein
MFVTCASQICLPFLSIPPSLNPQANVQIKENKNKRSWFSSAVHHRHLVHWTAHMIWTGTFGRRGDKQLQSSSSEVALERGSSLVLGVFGLPLLKFSPYRIECLNLRSGY